MLVKFNRREVTILRQFAVMAKARNKREWFSAKDATSVVLGTNDIHSKELAKTRNAFRRLVREGLLERYGEKNYSGYYRLTFNGVDFGLGDDTMRESIRPYGSMTDSYDPPASQATKEVPENCISGEEKPPAEITPRGRPRVTKPTRVTERKRKSRKQPVSKFEELKPTVAYGRKPLRKFSRKGRPPLRYRRVPKKNQLVEEPSEGKASLKERVMKAKQRMQENSSIRPRVTGRGTTPKGIRQRKVMAVAFGKLFEQ